MNDRIRDALERGARIMTAQQLADEAGTSPATARRHAQQLVDRGEALKVDNWRVTEFTRRGVARKYATPLRCAAYVWNSCTASR